MNSVNHAPHYRGELAVPEERHLVIPDSLAGKRIDQALAVLFPDCSRARLQQWIREGHVTVDDKPCATSNRIHGGEKVVVVMQPDAAETAFHPEAIPLKIVYEDDSILVVDKPAGLVVHPGSGNWSGTLLNALLQHVPANATLPRAGIVHRLDKDTSGLLVVAKTSSAHTNLVRQMQARAVGRTYAAIVHGSVARDATIEAPIGRHPRNRKRMAVIARGKPAKTRYSVIESGPGWTLLACSLETGRTHQIRVHLSSISHALIGDPVYRPTRMYATLPQCAREFARQALHAQRLRILHPQTGKATEWESPLPQDLIGLLDCLRNG